MERPDPDALLDKIQREEEKRQRGRLKVFFGASAGVGKTFAMLQAARRRMEEGVDVVVGLVETHGRKETLALVDGFDILAPARIEYRGRQLAEFDLDAALARKPGLILVDELAHSNVQGSRHLKRWQDVHELLDAGIDVYTTVNVQHLESLNDVVGQITGIRVWETVPDRVFDLADEVTLVDLPAEELLDRLREGKVYMPHQAENAVRNFFRKGNLIALRELALRRTADRVDAQMREYRADQSIERIWQARERIIVCVGAGPESATLVRAAARLASSLKADWLAVYVETPKLQRLPDAIRKRTLDALKLASELGAETVTLQGQDASQTLIAYARMRNVSKLVVGAAPTSGRLGWLRRSTAERLIRAAHDIDVTLVNSGTVRETAERGEAVTRFAGIGAGSGRSPFVSYSYAFGICAAITIVESFFVDRISLANLVMLYLLGTIFTAAKLGRGPGVMFSFLGVATFDFFFVPPRMSFTVSDTQYLLTFGVMLLTSLTISHLTASLRRQARIATLRERRTGAMFAMARELGAALTTAQIIEIGTRHVAEVFQARVAILLPDSAEKIKQKLEEPDMALTLDAASVDLDIAQWVYDQQKNAGHGTDTLPAARRALSAAESAHAYARRDRDLFTAHGGVRYTGAAAHDRYVGVADRAGARARPLRRDRAGCTRQHGIGAPAQLAALGDFARFAHPVDVDRGLRLDAGRSARRRADGRTRAGAGGCHSRRGVTHDGARDEPARHGALTRRQHAAEPSVVVDRRGGGRGVVRLPARVGGTGDRGPRAGRLAARAARCRAGRTALREPIRECVEVHAGGLSHHDFRVDARHRLRALRQS